MYSKTQKEAFTRNLKILRELKFPGRGSKTKIAEAIGIRPQQWGPWENGIRIPELRNLGKIASFFHVKHEELFDPELPERIGGSSLRAELEANQINTDSTMDNKELIGEVDIPATSFDYADMGLPLSFVFTITQTKEQRKKKPRIGMKVKIYQATL